MKDYRATDHREKYISFTNDESGRTITLYGAMIIIGRSLFGGFFDARGRLITRSASFDKPYEWREKTLITVDGLEMSGWFSGIIIHTF